MKMKMTWISATRAFALTALVGTLALTGCSKSETASDGTGESVAATDVDHDHEHGEWWCAEHGVPEDECAQCDKTLVSKFKDAGDWCDKHARPESQCFICSPKRFDKFAATYEAKMGHKPPQPE